MTAVLQPGGGQTPTDAELATAAARGDRHAFGQIYDRYADRLLDFSAGMLRDRDVAADCVHDAFCTAAGALGRLRDPDKLRPWLYAIVRSEVLHHIRDNRRETPVAEHVETSSHEPGPDAHAARSELAALVAEAAGGLSERDQLVLELAYRHGLDGPELAEVLGVSQTNANTMVHRLRDTVQRALGALLVARRARGTRDACAELRGVLADWDGTFTVLMRKRIARHIDSCDVCDQDRRRLVTPAALLGSAPVFLAAPPWLRESTLADIELVSHTSGLDTDTTATAPAKRSSSWLPATAFAVALVAVLGLGALYLAQRSDEVTPVDYSTTSTPTVAPVSAPTSTPTPVTQPLAPATTSLPAPTGPAGTTAPTAPTGPVPTPANPQPPAVTPTPEPPPVVEEPVPEPTPEVPEISPPTFPPVLTPWTPPPLPDPGRVPGVSDPGPPVQPGPTGLAPIPATPVVPTPLLPIP